jgi:pimeloyl-ACP methyl ester carboxylesterase
VEQGVTFYRHLPRGELAVFPKCGHNTYDQRPEDYARTVLDFIMRHKDREDQQDSRPVTCLA